MINNEIRDLYLLKNGLEYYSGGVFNQIQNLNLIIDTLKNEKRYLTHVEKLLELRTYLLALSEVANISC